MNALDSPLEALAFNYLSLGFLTVVNNLWPWVAVITAAVSFWRIRASGLPKSAPNGGNPDASSPTNTMLVAEPISTSDHSASLTTTANKAPLVCPAESTDSPTKRTKFTVFYNEDDDRECESGEGELGLIGEVNEGEFGGYEVVDGGDNKYWWCEGWERVLEMRMGGGEVGWYRYQDLTVLDGNVVRLWDGCIQRNAIQASASGGFMWPVVRPYVSTM